MSKLFLEHIYNQPADEDSIGVRNRPVFARSRHPLHLHLKTLAPGARLGWSHAPAPLIGYVWDGSVRVGDIQLPAQSVLVIEKGASGAAVASEEGGKLLLFGGGSDESHAGHAGGRIHVLPAQEAPGTLNLNTTGDVGATLWADADCPGCTLWLHGNSFRPGFVVKPHFHDEPEIIVVTTGTIVIGSRSYGRGSALQVSKFSEYTFAAGDDGLSYIVFHPRAPKLISRRYPAIDEQMHYHKACGKPQRIYVS